MGQVARAGSAALAGFRGQEQEDKHKIEQSRQ